MNVREIVTAFRTLRYELFLDGPDVIRYKYTGEGVPSKDKVLPLLNLLKQNKQEAIAFLQQAELETSTKKDSVVTVDYEKLFQDAVECLQKNYWSGALSFARENTPGMLNKAVNAENRINLFWGLNLEEFQMALKEWQEILIEISALYHDFQKRLCALCDNPGERLVWGQNRKGESKNLWFCLKCKPYPGLLKE